jgi:hypothetical protein
LVEKPDGKRHLGISGLRWEFSIEMDMINALLKVG